MGIYEGCLDLFSLVLVAGIFSNGNRVEILLKIHMDFSLFISLLRIRKTWLPCGYDKFHYCSSRQQSAKGENMSVSFF